MTTFKAITIIASGIVLSYASYQYGSGIGWNSGFKYGLERWEDQQRTCEDSSENQGFTCMKDGLNREYRLLSNLLE